MKNNKKKLLTVSIPTWDREDNLKLILERLAPQLDEDCIVNIIVNNSSYNGILYDLQMTNEKFANL